MKLQRMLLAIAIISGLTLATVSHAQHRHWWRTPAPADTTAPTTPTGLSASAITPTSVILSWGAATDNVGVTGYRVYVNDTLVVSSSSTSVQITELLAGGTRSFTVVAFDAAGNVSAPSAPLSVTTPPLTTAAPAPTPTPSPAPVPAPVDSIPPTTPTRLAASAITPTSVMLCWGAASDNVGLTGYR